MKKVKILIVEDNIIISETISRHLELGGYDVVDCVSSGEDALLSVGMYNPDLILMDINLDGEMDGIQTAGIIRKKLDLPVIFLTELSDKDSFNRAKDTKPASYLTKPFSEVDLMNTIDLTLVNWGEKHEIGELDSEKSEKVFVLKDHIFVRNTEGHFMKIKVEDIILIKAERSYSVLFSKQGKHIITTNLKPISSKVEHTGLVRIHRSYVINLTRITSMIGKKKVLIEMTVLEKKIYGDENFISEDSKSFELPIGDDFKDALNECLTCL